MTVGASIIAVQPLSEGYRSNEFKPPTWTTGPVSSIVCWHTWKRRGEDNAQLHAIPRQRWGTTRVADVMIPTEKLIAARVDEDLAEIMARMGKHGINHMPVFEGSKFLGMVARPSLVAFLRAHADAPGVGAGE